MSDATPPPNESSKGRARSASKSGDGPRGVFVVLEGIDGSGKTVQTERLAEALRARGHDVVETREPTDGVWGRRYRAWARGDLEASRDEVLSFFVEDRREHLDRIVCPALAAGRVVVCDRYVASTVAYQTASGLDRAHVRDVLAGAGFPEPDITLWLRLPVADALSRALARSEGERYERADFLARVDAEYAAMPHLIEVPAAGTPDDVTRSLLDATLAHWPD